MVDRCVTPLLDESRWSRHYAGTLTVVEKDSLLAGIRAYDVAWRFGRSRVEREKAVRRAQVRPFLLAGQSLTYYDSLLQEVADEMMASGLRCPVVSIRPLREGSS